MNMAEIREELCANARTEKVALQLPAAYGEGASVEPDTVMEFKRDEFLALYAVHDQIAEISSGSTFAVEVCV